MNKIIIALLLFVTLFCTGCGNTRFYIGVDDYGEPDQFEHNFTTRGHGDNARVAKNNKY